MLPKLDTILYCTGLGPNAEHIFRYAYSLAQQFGAKIVALHVMETLSRRQRAMVEGYSGLGSLSELLEKAKRDAATALPKRIEANKTSLLMVRFRPIEGGQGTLELHSNDPDTPITRVSSTRRPVSSHISRIAASAGRSWGSMAPPGVVQASASAWRTSTTRSSASKVSTVTEGI